MSSLRENLNISQEKIDGLMKIKVEFLEGAISVEEARERVNRDIERLTPEEFAYTEQLLKEEGYSDDLVVEKMVELLEIVGDILVEDALPKLPEGHPIDTYIKENEEVKKILVEIEKLVDEKFILNRWLEIYDGLNEYKVHLSRKQNQLYSLLEQKNFDRPSKIMWTFDNEVRDIISEGSSLLEKGGNKKFIDLQGRVVEKIRDIIFKEESVLFPTALELITEEEFKNLRHGDDEIGYALIKKPSGFYPTNENKESEFIRELSDLIGKYTSIKSTENLDVSTGVLSLEQINLIFKHMPIDISFVDENEIMRFYTDTDQRVFPRSKGVIGRDVKNCHPRESVGTVEKIINAFRNNEQDFAEFWLELKGKFIYIYYRAVRDEEGNFKGVLEMMQDATHIRSLEGSRRLLTWDETPTKVKIEEEKIENKYGLTKDTLIGDLVEKYPQLKEILPTISPKYKKLTNPVLFATMGKVATLEMVAGRGGFTTNELIEKLSEEISRI